MNSSQWMLNFKSWLQKLKNPHSITAFEITIFLRQFTTLISASIPVIQTCEILTKCQTNPRLRLLIYTIKRDLLTGRNLFYCLLCHPQYFDELTCRLIYIGEQTGKLEKMLATITSYHEKNHTFKQRIKQALFYPSVIVIIAILITLSMLLFVIPRFAELFQDITTQLPLLTQCIFYFSVKLREHIAALLMIFLAAVFFTFRNRHFAFQLLKKVGIKLPTMQSYLHKIATIRFARYLSLTLSAGIPITNALLLTTHVCGNDTFANLVINLHKKVNAGVNLHQAMTMMGSFPTLMIQMVKIGEESGMLEPMLNKFADFIEADMDQLLQRLNLLLEPLIMLVLGVLIGGLVIGMYLPIFKLGNAI
jgi:type IV pilus assembly protein PilC